MEYVKIENTELLVSRLAFGTASLHHIHSERERLRLLNMAIDLGFTHFDTSPYYGHGLAEMTIGLLGNERRNKIIVATKVGLYPPSYSSTSLTVWLWKGVGKLYPPLARPRVDWSVGTAEHSLSDSLRRLRRDYVDILFLHEPDPALVNSDEFAAWLERERSKGRIRYWGLAGEPSLLEAWVSDEHPLALVLQCRDSLEGSEADWILRHGRRPQITYGYLRSELQKGVMPARDILRRALESNRSDVILISTRRWDHLVELAEVVQ